jgi:hypothetical protein
MTLFHGEPGICRFCGCHGDECRLGDGDCCVWLDAYRDTCNSPACVRELIRRRKIARIEQSNMRKQRERQIDEVVRRRKRRHKRAGKRLL